MRGEGKCILNRFAPLLQPNLFRPVFFAPGLNTFNNNLVDRSEVASLDLFLNQLLCLRFDVDCHRVTYLAQTLASVSSSQSLVHLSDGFEMADACKGDHGRSVRNEFHRRKRCTRSSSSSATP